MKCLTYAESEAWFADFGVEIVRYCHLSFSGWAAKRRCIFVPNIVLDASSLGRPSAELVDWLPNGCERMLWPTNWSTYQPNPTILFETIRRGCNESRHIIDAPGHLFQSSAYDRKDYETRTKQDHEENNLLWGFLLL